jgi:hypothetical protein
MAILFPPKSNLNPEVQDQFIPIIMRDPQIIIDGALGQLRRQEDPYP